MFEQTVGLVMALNRGASIFYPESRQPRTLFKAIREQQATAMLVVPQVLQLFLAAIEHEVQKQGKARNWQRLKVLARHIPPRYRRLLFRSVHDSLGGHLEFFVCGGAGLEPSLVESWELLGVAVAQGYGTTETAPVIAATAPFDLRPGSVGLPVPGVSVRLAADGEILVKGPNVTPGYWQDAGATEAAFTEGWYRTGDLGEIDREGYIYLRGRKKSLIVLASGLNVFPEDVEAALVKVDGVHDAAVIGVPSDGGPKVHAVLLLESPAADPPGDRKEGQLSTRRLPANCGLLDLD